MRVFLLLCIFLSTVVLPASAQVTENFFGGGVFGAEASLTATPDFPHPLQVTRISLDDYSLGLRGARIEWFVNSQPIESATDQREIQLRMGELGETSEVEARVTAPNGQVFRAERTFNPVYTDVVVEPLTLTPFFYQGRGLPIFGSQVQLTALVHTSNGLIDPATHSYTWRLNNQVVQGGANRGNFKNVITIPHGRNQTISVTIENGQGRTIARQTIILPISTVDVQFYDVNTLYGISQQAIGDDDEVVRSIATYQAIPYNLDYRALDGPLHTAWEIDGVRTNRDARNPFEITINQQGTGTARISFEVRSLQELLQGDDHQVTVRF